MKIGLVKVALTVTLCSVMSFFAIDARAQQRTEAPLTNASVIKLVRAGFKDKTVIAIIRSRPAQFDLSPDRLIELKRASVSENIILAMLASDDTQFVAGDDWSDDPFFNDSAGGKANKTNKAGETDIFGMSGGSKSRIRERGAGGSGGGETETSGSATVRIVRPPIEAGSTPKLERTPTLTNDSIVELVEAGFSEGTIIRRIENAPADFDLTPPKLTELRRRRVSERIINAMTAAMSDDSTSGGRPSSNTPEQ